MHGVGGMRSDYLTGSRKEGAREKNKLKDQVRQPELGPIDSRRNLVLAASKI